MVVLILVLSKISFYYFLLSLLLLWLFPSLRGIRPLLLSHHIAAYLALPYAVPLALAFLWVWLRSLPAWFRLLRFLPTWFRLLRDPERAAQAKAVARFVLSEFLSLLSPPILWQSLLQALGEALVLRRYRSQPPLPDTYRQEVPYTLPFQGVWFVANGGSDPRTSHSWDLLGQRFAYDFIIVDEEGKSHRGEGRRLEDYYAFGAPILAPADGVVVAVENRHRDCPWPGVIDPFAWSALGNYVVIRHGEREYSLLAHLRRGSVRVRPGERVVRGQVVGECGNSGHSTEPHLHFSVQDGPHPFFSASLPVRYRGWCRVEGEGCREVEEGFPVRGERVESLAQPAPREGVAWG